MIIIFSIIEGKLDIILTVVSNMLSLQNVKL